MPAVPVLLTTTSEDCGQQHGEELMVSFQTPLPGNLHAAMGRFIEKHPQWDQYRLMQAALAGFLLQNGVQKGISPVVTSVACSAVVDSLPAVAQALWVLNRRRPYTTWYAAMSN